MEPDQNGNINLQPTKYVSRFQKKDPSKSTPSSKTSFFKSNKPLHNENPIKKIIPSNVINLIDEDDGDDKEKTSHDNDKKTANDEDEDEDERILIKKKKKILNEDEEEKREDPKDSIMYEVDDAIYSTYSPLFTLYFDIGNGNARLIPVNTIMNIFLLNEAEAQIRTYHNDPFILIEYRHDRNPRSNIDLLRNNILLNSSELDATISDIIGIKGKLSDTLPGLHSKPNNPSNPTNIVSLIDDDDDDDDDDEKNNDKMEVDYDNSEEDRNLKEQMDKQRELNRRNNYYNLSDEIKDVIDPELFKRDEDGNYISNPQDYAYYDSIKKSIIVKKIRKNMLSIIKKKKVCFWFLFYPEIVNSDLLVRLRMNDMHHILPFDDSHDNGKLLQRYYIYYALLTQELLNNEDIIEFKEKDLPTFKRKLLLIGTKRSLSIGTKVKEYCNLNGVQYFDLSGNEELSFNKEKDDKEIINELSIQKEDDFFAYDFKKEERDLDKPMYISFKQSYQRIINNIKKHIEYYVDRIFEGKLLIYEGNICRESIGNDFLTTMILPSEYNGILSPLKNWERICLLLFIIQKHMYTLKEYRKNNSIEGYKIPSTSGTTKKDILMMLTTNMLLKRFELPQKGYDFWAKYLNYREKATEFQCNKKDPIILKVDNLKYNVENEVFTLTMNVYSFFDSVETRAAIVVYPKLTEISYNERVSKIELLEELFKESKENYEDVMNEIYDSKIKPITRYDLTSKEDSYDISDLIQKAEYLYDLYFTKSKEEFKSSFSDLKEFFRYDAKQTAILKY